MKPIYLTSPINNLSYGIVSQNILNELVKKRTVLLSILGRQEILNKNVHESIRNFQEIKVDNTTSSVKIYHQFDLAHHIGKGNHIGFPFFELDEFSALEKKHLSLQDVILVASNWAKEMIGSQIETKCEVVPLGVDTSIFYSKPQHTNTCVFLNIGKMEYRKGHDILLKACERVFKGKNDCMLWMVSNNPFVDCSSFEKQYRQTLGSSVAFLPKVSNQNEIAAIINRSNYGIFPYRAEGWCFLENTLILTNKGVKYIKDIEVGEIIADHKGSKSKVINTLKRSISENILKIKAVSTPYIYITKEHKVLAIKNTFSSIKTFTKKYKEIKPAFYKVSELKKGDYLFVPKYKTSNSNLYKDSNTEILLNNDIIRLFGYYVAEGSTNRSTTTFSFHQKEKDYHEDVLFLIKEFFGVDPIIKFENRNRANIIFHSQLLGEMLHNMFGRRAKNKKVPYDFLFLDEELQKSFLIGAFRGDGTHSPRKCYKENRPFSYSTVSETLAWQIKQMLVNIGCKPSIYLDKKGLDYRITVSGSDRELINFDNINFKKAKKDKFRTKIYENYVITPIDSIEEEFYEGLVYNLSMDGENTYNICGFAVHNCMPLLESLACGLTVAATNYSAPTEYLTKENSYMIDVTEKERAYDGVFFDGSKGRWAKLDEKYEDNLVDIMEHMYSDWKKSRYIPNSNGIETAFNYTWEKTVDGILKYE